MARFSRHRLPRGFNFLLGGVLVAVVLLVVALLSGIIDVGIGDAPQVRIDKNAASARAAGG